VPQWQSDCCRQADKAVLADTPLVENLEKEKCLSVLLDGKSSLEERFAEIDAKEVHNQILKLRDESDLLPPKNLSSRNQCCLCSSNNFSIHDNRPRSLLI